MASRGILIKKRRQISQVFAECLPVLDSGAGAYPKFSGRIFEITADRATCSTETSRLEIPDCQFAFGKLSRQEFRQEFRHCFRAPTCIGRKLFSSVADVGSNTSDASWAEKHFLRGMNPEDLTSRKISRTLRKWTSNTPIELAKLEVPWSPFIVCRVLKNDIRADAAWQFFNWVKTQRDYRHNVYTYSAMIDLFGKAKDIPAIGRLVEEMHQEGLELNVVTYTTLMHWYRRAMDLTMVRRIWKQMKEKAVRPNVVTYTNYIDALAKAKCPHEAMEVYQEMQDSRCRPNIYTYTVLIHSLVEAGKLEVATELFNRLGEVHCKPNSVTYSLLIGAHSKAGNLEKVLALFRAMKESGLRTSLEQRKLVTRALEGVGMAEEAEQLRSGVNELKVLLKLSSESVIPIENHDNVESVVPRHRRPMQLARKLRVWGPETDAILAKVGRKLKPPYVMNVLKELQTNAPLAWRFFQWADAQEGYKHTQYTYMKMMEIVGRVPRTDSNDLKEKVLAQLEQEGTDDLDKFNTLIKYYSEYQNIDAAEKVFDRVTAVGCKPSETTYTLLIDMYSRAGMHTKALTVYEEMQKAECIPSMHTYTVLMHSLARAGKISEAEMLFESLPSLGRRPNVVTYTALMQSLINIGEDGKALALFERMKENRISPSKITLKVLSKGLRNAGRIELAQKIAEPLPYMRGMVLEPEESLWVRKGEKEVRELMSSSFPQSAESSDASSGEPYSQTAV